MSRGNKQRAPTEKAVKVDGPIFEKTGLDRLLPMHIWVGPTGHVVHAGPTIKKLRPEGQLVGGRITELLEFRRPRGIQTMRDFIKNDGAPIQVSFRRAPRSAMKGLIVALPNAQGVLLNLSLGISIGEMVGQFRLKAKDFAPSDPTVEMLYLIEAQSAILQESKNLNSRLQGAKIAAEEHAYTDTLTGLKNRRALDHILERLVAGTPTNRFGLMNMDLDYFKSVNDTYGHAAGDHVLQEAAKIFLEETRSEDVIARTGGDEFVLILANCDDRDVLNTIAARIIKRLEKPILYDGVECLISASIGISISSNYDRLSAAQICNDADMALYESKNKGRACHTFFDTGATTASPEPDPPQHGLKSKSATC